MTKPTGFENPGYVCRLRKPIDGWSEASSKHQGCGFPLAARSDQEVEEVSNLLANKLTGI
jgi:hypothetical protein